MEIWRGNIRKSDIQIEDTWRGDIWRGDTRKSNIRREKTWRRDRLRRDPQKRNIWRADIRRREKRKGNKYTGKRNTNRGNREMIYKRRGDIWERETWKKNYKEEAYRKEKVVQIIRRRDKFGKNRNTKRRLHRK